jgi:deoxyhypusine synthase
MADRWAQNTGQEFDGSDSGARPDEAVSWGKIRAGAQAVKVKAYLKTSFLLLNIVIRCLLTLRSSSPC